MENSPLKLLNLTVDKKVVIDNKPETDSTEKPKRLNKCMKAKKYLLENENATQLEIFHNQIKLSTWTATL